MANNAVSWTPMQSAAIETRNKTLLVSAAAGSGKTAVLTERIVKRLCDKNDPADISRMLIVTYTKAAANELKVRISKAISGAIAKDVTNRHLRKQLLLLSSAKISTIHSFCFDVVKSNSKALGLPAAITIAGEPELLILARQIMSKVIDDAYNNIYSRRQSK
ncbi:MAG: helicase-exonuclease AddAB subunit AddA, partial [Ruminococcaceae bacterium]|nr:helicase-exonuclease AddAB subunit AddA [Oscillospiraceae bacterium]